MSPASLRISIFQLRFDAVDLQQSKSSFGVAGNAANNQANRRKRRLRLTQGDCSVSLGDDHKSLSISIDQARKLSRQDKDRPWNWSQDEDYHFTSGHLSTRPF